MINNLNLTVEIARVLSCKFFRNLAKSREIGII